MSIEAVVGTPAMDASRYGFPPHPLVSARLLLALRDVGHSQRVAHGSVASRHHGAPLPLRGGQLVGGRRRSPPWPRCSPLVTAMVFLGRRAAGARVCDLESRLARGRVSGLARRARITVGNRLHECCGPSLSCRFSVALTRNWRTQQCSGLATESGGAVRVLSRVADRERRVGVLSHALD